MAQGGYMRSSRRLWLPLSLFAIVSCAVSTPAIYLSAQEKSEDMPAEQKDKNAKTAKEQEPTAPAQKLPAETGGCAPLEVDVTASHPARTSGTPGHAIPPLLKVPGLRGFGQITPTLYRGGRPTEEGLACIAKMGVSIVISQEGSFKDLHEPVERLGMRYVSIPWECSFPRDRTIAKFLQLLRDNRGKKVFVYCHYGDDRTGMMIAAFRMAEQGWSAEEAKEEMMAFGFDFFHRRICTGLSSYEEHFPSHWRESQAFEKLRSSAQH
jgi:tyrosine-protein phosphatase SIW14